MRVMQKYGKDDPGAELLKIPLEGLHSIALQQIGEQESYIEELEDKIRSLEEELARKLKKEQLTKEENKRIAQEVRREEVIAVVERRSAKMKAENKKLLQRNRELAVIICQRNSELYILKERLRKYEQVD
jgi:hypothetical protein